MCMFSQPDTPEVAMPKEPAQMKSPDGEAVRSNTSRRTMDRMRAGTQTILTSGSGVTQAAPTGKTLLGQ
ncbi:hypothetical protein GOC60_14670 [Sinorhizobium meliloti]|nr:hypothetical protein [Sinorhizobium meliloti]MDX0262424.1 hypothetical protein [Sinorhizobium meliloti]